MRDGWRILAYKDGARVRLVSRNGRKHTRHFASIAAAIAKVSARALVLDGEVAIYDQELRSRFDWLREPDADETAPPPVLMAFDLRCTWTASSSLAGRCVSAALGWRKPSRSTDSKRGWR